MPVPAHWHGSVVTLPALCDCGYNTLKRCMCRPFPAPSPCPAHLTSSDRTKSLACSEMPSQLRPLILGSSVRMERLGELGTSA